MDDIQRKRESLKTVYPNQTWSKKVDKMSDNAVVALYLKWRAQNKI